LSLYETAIEHAGRGPLFWMLVALLVTFVATRAVTRRIRAGSTGLKNWQIGGVHVHHQVFGVLAVIVSGSLEFAYRPASPWSDMLGAVFGAGVSLTLDEFALWLHLDDVYWSPQGRKSIDAVFVAIVLTALLLVGVTPLDLSEPLHEVLASVALALLLNLGLIAVCFLKGKPIVAIVGFLIPTVALVGSLRLAKPGSQWAAWRYPAGSGKRTRSERRFGPRYQARWNRVRDLVGGAPDRSA
jgi:hypothetical protein